ncbi:MAG: hypothetical protein H6779_05115 [Candidatus Nomurabacteria bacterium]|nr:hypothetical protein [Candidatus Nomurabacteria bacterium]USN87748.1 MAG: hypothetical protein H6779_05115 [Candidatus Nomurabacteria bacterium]
MQLLGILGIDIWLLIAQIVNFALLLWVLTRLVYKPLIRRIEQDEDVIARVKEAEIALVEKEKKLEGKQKRYETRVKNKAKSIIAEAEEIAVEVKERAKEETEREKAAVLAQIRQRLSEIDKI